jgi:dTDP-4-amino-4,6-dideoxygalactose transaminase
MVHPDVPFNKPYLTGNELTYIEEAHKMLQLAGDGYFTKKCSDWLESNTGSHRALITHSCTAALEMCALLINIQAGDEIIMPSYTFVSTANAFALRGATIRFADIDPVTLNISPDEISRLISKHTKAVVIVHYAGVACEMDRILELCRRNNIFLIEDAAQALLAYHNESHLGTIGDFGCLSFHETKNVIAGEGGALLINNPDFVEKAEVIREKGANRSRFFRGEVDKYSWVNIGSSFLPGEITTAFLWAQLEEAQNITRDRLRTWAHYDRLLSRTFTSYAGPPESLSSALLAAPSVPGLLAGCTPSRCPRTRAY